MMGFDLRSKYEGEWEYDRQHGHGGEVVLSWGRKTRNIKETKTENNRLKSASLSFYTFEVWSIGSMVHATRASARKGELKILRLLRKSS